VPATVRSRRAMRGLIQGFVDLSDANPALVSFRTASRITAPGVDLRVAAPASIARTEARLAVAAGSPRFPELSGTASAAASWLLLWQQAGERAPELVKGEFAVALIDLASRSAMLATDRFAISPLCYAFDGKRLRFADRADAVMPAAAQSLDAQAIFDYVYFHVIPGPRTVFTQVKRLPGGHRASVAGTRVDVNRYWQPQFTHTQVVPMDEYAMEFKRLLREAVSRDSADRCGSFLSGGTDSSTIAGMLCAVKGEPAETFSIGFRARGYDEMEYARIASRHFGTRHHEYYVAPADVADALSRVATHFDQPFGNSSALPAYFCARLAQECGVEALLAGDGGDELFGGNSRYARQRLFALYDAAPAWLRSGPLDAFARSKAAAGVPWLRKVQSYVRQARIPMPERMETYNLLIRMGTQEVFHQDFLQSVDVNAPRVQQREIYCETAGEHLINRMLAYDWKYTLADNDLPKVIGATNLARVGVRFPLLANEIVDFSLALPPRCKLNGLELRHFFKFALRDFLPREILAKKKHGFGLPFGVWLAKDPALHALATDALACLAPYGIIREQFTSSLLDQRLVEHPGYYGEMVWILMVLSNWLESRRTATQAETLAVESG
jgi:asparagine synthase (glutamine-hydrolysing)